MFPICADLTRSGREERGLARESHSPESDTRRVVSSSPTMVASIDFRDSY